MESRNLVLLPAFDEESGEMNVIVETPKNSRVKYKYSENYGLFQLDKALPYGFSFPFEFGFVPSTLGGDGDPLDVLVIADEATFPGCLVLGHVLGVLQGNQSEGKKVNRNDRVVVVPIDMAKQKPMLPPKTLNDAMISKITDFFVAYNAAQGRKFKPIGFGNRMRALELVEEARKRKLSKGN